MDWTEKYIEKLNNDLADIKAETRTLRVEIQGSLQETRTEIRESLLGTVDRALTEVRERDAQRHAESLALMARNDTLMDTVTGVMGTLTSKMDAISARMDAVMARMDTVLAESRGANRWVMAFAIAAIASVLGIAISAIAAFITLISG